MKDCLFCKIANNANNCVYEDEKIVIINDINPQANIHMLVIPKEHYTDVNDLSINNSELLGYIFKKIAEIKDILGLQDGFRVITNIGNNGRQSIKHVHFHILGGEQLADKMG